MESVSRNWQIPVPIASKKQQMFEAEQDLKIGDIDVKETAMEHTSIVLFFDGDECMTCCQESSMEYLLASNGILVV